MLARCRSFCRSNWRFAPRPMAPMNSSRRATVRRHTRRSSRRGESQPHRMSGNHQLVGQAHSDWHLLSYLPRQPPHRLPGLLLTPASMRTSDPHVSENVNQVAVDLNTPFYRERAAMAPAPEYAAKTERHNQLAPLGSASWPKQDRTKLRSHTRESAGGQPEPEYSTSQPLLGIWIELLQSLVESPINHLLRPAQALLCVGDANAELLGRLRSCKPLLQA